jgi:hypothetical protein
MTTAPSLKTAVRPRITKAVRLIEPALVESLPRTAIATLFDLRKKPGYYNAAANTALLRRSKAPPHDELLVDFSRAECHIELRASGTSLLHGPWTFQAAAAGRALAAAGPWQQTCWESDKACDYLELERPLAGGWRLERQILLARADRFLLLADALLAPAGESAPLELHYDGSLALQPEAAFAPASQTREGRLHWKQRAIASVVPLALPEWRADFGHAELAASAGRLSLAQKALGGNLYAPLWIDLDRSRQRRSLTWRRLTVAENLTIVPRDVAAAYRVQVGREQWLIYRSLAQRGNRTFLGHNTHHEFVCHRFLPTGETESIIEIE